ncbi:hypothetical protein [uncultured Thermus sp.]|uniref:hypothetical protein n=1 Tax=uncultured Thermus sp. TaxID=157149 RepID=UPI00262079E7|nr:hypothetical protein [uncultured Thermus sp.]
MLRKLVLAALVALGFGVSALAGGDKEGASLDRYAGGFFVYATPGDNLSLERYAGGFYVYRYTGGFFVY